MPETPAFAPIPRWQQISGMGRSATYEALGTNKLRAIKCGRSLLIDVEHGLAYLRSLPPAKIRPRTTPRHRNAAEPDVAPQPQPAPLQRRNRGRPRRPHVQINKEPAP